MSGRESMYNSSTLARAHGVRRRKTRLDLMLGCLKVFFAPPLVVRVQTAAHFMSRLTFRFACTAWQEAMNRCFPAVRPEACRPAG